MTLIEPNEFRKFQVSLNFQFPINYAGSEIFEKWSAVRRFVIEATDFTFQQSYVCWQVLLPQMVVALGHFIPTIYNESVSEKTPERFSIPSAALLFSDVELPKPIKYRNPVFQRFVKGHISDIPHLLYKLMTFYSSTIVIYKRCQ